MEKQISAVEWFNQEIKELFNKHQDGEISGSIFHFERLVALTKAKQMEKEQKKEYNYYKEYWEVRNLKKTK